MRLSDGCRPQLRVAHVSCVRPSRAEGQASTNRPRPMIARSVPRTIGMAHSEASIRFHGETPLREAWRRSHRHRGCFMARARSKLRIAQTTSFSICFLTLLPACIPCFFCSSPPPACCFCACHSCPSDSSFPVFSGSFCLSLSLSPP